MDADFRLATIGGLLADNIAGDTINAIIKTIPIADINCLARR
jgi:hypothetical protein